MSRALELIVAAVRQAPFLVLGPRVLQRTLYVRVYLPRAMSAELVNRRGKRLPMRPFGMSGLFEWRGSGELIGKHPLVAWRDFDCRHHLQRDPYSFDVGATPDCAVAGAHAARYDGFAGTCFAVHAADATAVNVLGEFNDWCPDIHPLARSAVSGVWALFVPGAAPRGGHRFEVQRGRAFDGNQTVTLDTARDLVRRLGEPNMATRKQRTRAASPATTDDRHAQIAQAAYLRAEQRRFAPGHELEDWLEAEREFDATAPTTKPRKR